MALTSERSSGDNLSRTAGVRRSRMRSRIAILARCSSIVPGTRSETVSTSWMSVPCGSAASLRMIWALTAGTCSGVSASMTAPEMLFFPPNTSSALFDHSAAPPALDPLEPSLSKLYSHGSRRYAGSLDRQRARQRAPSRPARTPTARARSRARSRRMTGPARPSMAVLRARRQETAREACA
jgi:hypothetical protein